MGDISEIQNRDKVKPPIPLLNQTVGLHLCPEAWFETDTATAGLVSVACGLQSMFSCLFLLVLGA